MSDGQARVPPLFWINDAGSGLTVSVTVSGRRAICFFSLELAALGYAEHHLGGELGVDWHAVGSEDSEDLYRVIKGAPREGFDGWVLNPPISGHDHRVSSWSELRDEVEHKLKVGAAWGSAPSSSRPRGDPNEAQREEASNSMVQNDWREMPPDPETAALWRLSSPAVNILEGPSSPFEKPLWVEEFEWNRRHLELFGREGVETLDAWRAQTEERIAALLARRPWSLLHVLGLLRRLPTDAAFLGEKEQEDAPSRFDAYQAAVTERAALKYARWDASGVDLDFWEPGMPGLAQDRPAVDTELVAEIFALTRLGGLHLAYVERMRRAIVRGQTVVLHPDGVSDSRPGPELRRRLGLYEERRHRFSFLGETAGTFGPSQPDGTAANDMSASHVLRTTYREDEGEDWWRYETSRRLIRKRDKRFVFSAANLRPAYEYLKLLENEVIAQYGISPEIIVAALLALEMAVVNFVSPEGSEVFFPERIAYLDKRGYLIIHDAVMDGVVLGPWSAEAHRRAFPNISLPAGSELFAHGLKRLAYLDSYRREDLRLEDGKPWVQRPDLDGSTPMPPPFVYPAGEHRIVDLTRWATFYRVSSTA